MGISAVSHVAVGVRSMDRSLPFWRDVLGLPVVADQEESFRDLQHRGAPLRVLGRRRGDDRRSRRDAGVEVVVEPSIGDTWLYGEPAGGKVKVAFLRDPDGNVVQLGERVEVRPQS
jgi:catechol 2,3-dioxygenase-like lactoylglutathione lyase family enzyme